MTDRADRDKRPGALLEPTAETPRQRLHSRDPIDCMGTQSREYWSHPELSMQGFNRNADDELSRALTLASE